MCQISPENPKQNNKKNIKNAVHYVIREPAQT